MFDGNLIYILIGLLTIIVVGKTTKKLFKTLIAVGIVAVLYVMFFMK